MESIKEQQTLLESLQEVRYELTKVDMKKSGYNGHLKFNYFELKDFVPIATKLFYERGVTPMFTIECDANGIEYAYMHLFKGSERVAFKVPTAETAMPNPIQGLGAKITYLRRYMYLIVLDLVENDIIDAEADVPKANLITNDQWIMLNKLYTKDEVKAMYKELGITNGKQIPKDVAQKMIDKKSISDEEATAEKAFF